MRVDAARRRSARYLGDGNFGGYYERPDEDMLAIWDVAVAETRALHRGRLGMSAADPDLGRRRHRRHARRRLRPRRRDVALRRPRCRTTSRRSTRDGLEITGPDRSGSRSAPALPARRASTGRFDRILLCVKAHDTEAAATALAPHLAEDGYVVSVQNGLNELVIAEVGRRASGRSAASSISAPTISGPASSIMPAAAPSWWASSTAAARRGIERTPRAASELRAERRPHRQHLGLSLEQADLWRAAVRHRAHRRLDRRSCWTTGAIARS